MAIWDNHSETTKKTILEGIRAFSKMLRKDKRKEKINNVLCTRSNQPYNIQVSLTGTIIRDNSYVMLNPMGVQIIESPYAQ